MKNILIAVVASLLLFLQLSCKKDSTPEEKTISGLWIGTYEIIQGDDYDEPLYYSFYLDPNNKILVQGQGADGNTYYSQGTWSLSGNAFTARTTTGNLSQSGVVQNITATYNKDMGTLTEGSVISVGINFSSSFSLHRVN